MFTVPLAPAATSAVGCPRKLSIGSGAKRARPRLLLVGGPRQKKPPVFFLSFHVPLRGPQASPKAGVPSAVSYSATSAPDRVQYPYCPALTATGPLMKQLAWQP